MNNQETGEKKQPTMRPWSGKEVFLCAVIVGLGLGLRVLAEANYADVLIGDPAEQVEFTRNISFDPRNLSLPISAEIIRHPFLLQYLIKISFLTFRESALAARLPSLLAGLLSIFLIFLLVRGPLGTVPALLSALLLSFSQFHIGWSRIVHQEMPMLASVILSVYLFWKALTTEKRWLVLLVGPSVALAFLAKETALFLLPVFFIYLLLTPSKRFWLKRKEVYLSLVLFLVLVGPYLWWTYKHPTPYPGYLGLTRFSKLPLDFYLLISLGLRKVPAADYARLSLWSWPPVYWPVGIILLTGSAASIIYYLFRRRHDFITLMVIFFLFVMGFFFFLIPYKGTSEYWWLSITLIPATVLTAGLLSNLARTHIVLGLAVLLLFVFLGFQALNYSLIKAEDFPSTYPLTVADYDFELAQYYLEKGEVDKALAELERGLSLFPNEIRIHNLLGGCYFKKGLYHEARRHWETVLGIDPENQVAKKAVDFLNSRNLGKDAGPQILSGEKNESH